MDRRDFNSLALVSLIPVSNLFPKEEKLEIPYKIQLEAVKQNGFAIQFIKNPSEEMQLEAVKQIKISTIHNFLLIVAQIYHKQNDSLTF